MSLRWWHPYFLKKFFCLPNPGEAFLLGTLSARCCFLPQLPVETTWPWLHTYYILAQMTFCKYPGLVYFVLPCYVLLHSHLLYFVIPCRCPQASAPDECVITRNASGTVGMQTHAPIKSPILGPWELSYILLLSSTLNTIPQLIMVLWFLWFLFRLVLFYNFILYVHIWIFLEYVSTYLIRLPWGTWLLYIMYPRCLYCTCTYICECKYWWIVIHYNAFHLRGFWYWSCLYAVSWIKYMYFHFYLPPHCLWPHSKSQTSIVFPALGMEAHYIHIGASFKVPTFPLSPYFLNSSTCVGP